MRMPTVLVLLASLLAGCADAGTVTRSVPRGPAGAASVNWTASLTGDMLEVQLTDPSAHYRVDRVELVGPAGPTSRAFEMTRETTRTAVRSGSGRGVDVGIGGGYGSSGHGEAGIGLSIPLGGPPPAPPPAIRTVARIALPDPAAYRRAPELWSIRVTLRDAGGASSVAYIPVPLPRHGGPSTTPPTPLHNK